MSKSSARLKILPKVTAMVEAAVRATARLDLLAASRAISRMEQLNVGLLVITDVPTGGGPYDRPRKVYIVTDMVPEEQVTHSPADAVHIALGIEA